MNKALNFVRLDFITVKPYMTFKNLIIFFMVPFIFIISSGSSAAAMGMFMALAVLYVSYPFAVGEKNGIDSLYPTLSIRRSAVVLGRYLFALLLDFSAGVFAYFYSFAAFRILRKDFDTSEALTVLLVLFIVFSVIQAVQLPIYFKLGYAKAKLFAYLPFMIFPLVILAANNLFGDIFKQHVSVFLEWIVKNPFIASALGILIWLGIMAVSCKMSLVFYNKRDF